MTLYSYLGAYPTPIPFRIRLSNGITRTDPSTFTSEELTDAGYVPVSNQPNIINTQVVEWSSQLVDWVVRDKTPEELAVDAEQNRIRLTNEINIHRDRLIARGFYFNNIKFDSRSEDQKRISGAGLLAFMAITQGAQPGNYLWHGGTEPFAWIAQDNSIVEMDAYTVVAFGKAAAEHERAHIFAARELKDMNPIPTDYADSIYWPIVSQDGSSIE